MQNFRSLVHLDHGEGKNLLASPRTCLFSGSSSDTIPHVRTGASKSEERALPTAAGYNIHGAERSPIGFNGTSVVVFSSSYWMTDGEIAWLDKGRIIQATIATDFYDDLSIHLDSHNLTGSQRQAMRNLASTTIRIGKLQKR